jgi:copper oxidase (laccase) domain-containing protein
VSGFEWKRADGVPWLEHDLPGGHAAFSTRHGGHSSGAFASLNLGILTDDDPALVAANREQLARALGRAVDGIAMGRQVHGAAVQVHTEPAVL